MTHTRALAASLCILAIAPLTAQDRTIDLLRQLTDAPGPPGFEEPIRKVMVDLMKPYASSITFDGMGSIIAAQGSQGPRIMVDAHMDELGGVVRRVTPRGLLTMQMLGGWLDQALVDQRWIIVGSKGPVRAVTGIRDVHVVPPEERTRVYSREGGITGDVFPGRPEETQARLGAGPGIFLYDSSALPNRKLTALVKQTAAEKSLPLQQDLVQGYGDDSAELQKSNGGVPTVNLVVPIRYTHSHNGIMNRRDFDQMVDLLVALLQKLDAAAVARVRDFTP